MATIDLELVQNYNTDFLLYDGTNRTLCPGDALPIADITRVTVVFKSTSDFLTEDKTFIIDNGMQAIHEGTADLSAGYQWAIPTLSQTLILSYNGAQHILTLNSNCADLVAIVTYFNDVLFNNVTDFANRIEAFIVPTTNYLGIRTVNSGYIENFSIDGGTALTTLGWTTGTYHGSGLNFTTITQAEFIYPIKYTDFNMGWTEMPEGNWVMEITTESSTNDPIVQNFEEFTFKQSEKYWAKMYETLARSPQNYLEFEYRIMDNYEKFILLTADYDSRIKAIKASLGVGDVPTARNILLYCQNVRNLNPIA